MGEVVEVPAGWVRLISKGYERRLLVTSRAAVSTSRWPEPSPGLGQMSTDYDQAIAPVRWLADLCCGRACQLLRPVERVFRRMRCSGACGGRVGSAWLVTLALRLCLLVVVATVSVLPFPQLPTRVVSLW